MKSLTCKEVLYELARKAFEAGLVSEEEIKKMCGAHRFGNNHKNYRNYLRASRILKRKVDDCESSKKLEKWK